MGKFQRSRNLFTNSTFLLGSLCSQLLLGKVHKGAVNWFPVPCCALFHSEYRSNHSSSSGCKTNLLCGFLLIYLFLLQFLFAEDTQ